MVQSDHNQESDRRPAGPPDRLPALGWLEGSGRTRICYKIPMHASGVQHLLPIASVVAGVFLLIAPRIMSLSVAVYLIFVGLLGLNGIYHLFK